MRESSSIPRVAPDLVWRLLDDNAVVVSPRVGEVRVLNLVGTVIWQLLLEDKCPDEIEDYLVANFQVSHQQAKSDMQDFFDDLTERGIIYWEARNTQQTLPNT